MKNQTSNYANEMMNTKCTASRFINCTSDKEYISAINKLESQIIKYGFDINNYDFKSIPFYFDRGFLDGYRKYDSYFAITKDIIDKVKYATLDFQCGVLELFDENNVVLMTTTTECYDDIATPKAFFHFNDDLEIQ